MDTAWYGDSPAFRLGLEAAAKKRYGRHLRVDLQSGFYGGKFAATLTYELDELVVFGRVDPVQVTVRFTPNLPEWLQGFGPRPEDYPLVYADSDKPSPHRLGRRALCLYHPDDPPSRRWLATRGLDELFNLTARHLYLEERWRRNAEWAALEAGHGLSRAA